MTTGRPDSILGQFGSTSQRVKVNLLSPAIAIWFDCGLLAVLCCHLATENVMKLLFWPLATWQHGDGVCCAAHHSLFTSCSCAVFSSAETLSYAAISYYELRCSSMTNLLWEVS